MNCEEVRARLSEFYDGELPAEKTGDLLVDSRVGAKRLDRAEELAWAEWQSVRISPRCVLGEALSAAMEDGAS